MEQYHFNTALEISTNKLWGAHIRVPNLIAQVFVEASEDRRAICTLFEKSRFHCALLHDGNGGFLITVNKGLRDKYKLKEGSPVQASLSKDESEYGLPMPEEFAELLKQDEEGDKLFHALTPGKIRTLLYIIGSVKSSDLRLFRGICVLEHLKSNKGKIDFKALNVAMKQKD